MPFPNTFLIGAAKSGTTSVYRALGQHPEIYTSPRKEPMFFGYAPETRIVRNGVMTQATERFILDREEYRALFDEVGDESVICEGSTSYLYRPEAPKRIKEEIGEARFVAILRNPITRAFSAFGHARLERWESEEDFSRALGLEPGRIEADWEPMVHYVQQGHYVAQISRWREFWPADRLRFYLYDDLVRAPDLLFRDMFRFFGVEDTFQPDLSTRVHAARAPRSQTVHRFLKRRSPALVSAAGRAVLSAEKRARLYQRLYERNLTTPQPLSEEAADILRSVFREEIEALSGILSRDLRPWLVSEPASPPSGPEVGVHPAL